MVDGVYVLELVCKINGNIEFVNDIEIIEGIKLLVEIEGIFIEIVGGIIIVVLKKLVEVGKIDFEEIIVVYIIGNGLKI